MMTAKNTGLVEIKTQRIQQEQAQLSQYRKDELKCALLQPKKFLTESYDRANNICQSDSQ